MTPARRLGIWLAIWAVMLYLLILIGGATRLTESGLSITEWKPVSGVIPPIGAAEWDAAFARYRQIPQYAAMNAGMTVGEFKRIFLWEYTHRLWARLVGVAFLVPLLYFLARGWVPRAMRGRLWLLLVLLGLQGALGWFMVSSGLSGRTEVSQYRLAAHLAAALLIYGATVWTAADFLARPRAGLTHDARALRRSTWWITGMAFLTAIAGAFVAGLRAGRVFNTFPLMGGQLVPPGYGALVPWWRNLFENPGAVQFDHRLLALVTATTVLVVWWRGRRRHLSPVTRTALNRVAALVVLQVGLGIATLLLMVPVSLGVAHQGGAVLLVTAGLLLMHSVRPAAAD
jgi:cytochrome c oxidase assembly protein subunit 15